MRNTKAKSSVPAKTAKAKSSVIVDKLEEMSPSNPLPFEDGRGFTFVEDTEYIPFLNPDDNYGQLLLQSRLLSATHNACIITKKNYCAGIGLQTRDEQDITDKNVKTWLRSMNVRNESFIEINKQIFESFFTWGNAPIELIRLTIGGKKYMFVQVHNFLEWRLAKPDPNDGISKSAIQTKLFLKDRTVYDPEDYKNVRRLPIYNPRYGNKKASKYRDGINWLVDSKGAERTLIWYKNSVAGYTNYGLPSAMAALLYAKLEYKSGRFDLDNLENNAVMSALLVLKGNLTQREINTIGRRIINQHTGDGKRGRIIVTGSEEGIDGSDLHNFNTSKEGSFKESNEMWSQKIILAHEWDAVLAGIVQPGALGKGLGFLTKIMEWKRKYVVIPAQMDLIDNVWNSIMTEANKWLGTKIDVDNIQIQNLIDISGLTDVDITPAVTVDEVRLAKDLPKAKKNGDKMLGELGADQKRGVYVKDNKGNKEDPEDV